MIEDLLRGTVHDAWVDELDFSTLHHETEISVSDQLDERVSDVVWSVRWRDRELFLLILVEFQSRPERFMALRKLEYVARFYRQLSRQKRFLSRRRLPPVLPIVVYNGERAWRAPCRLSELIAEVPDELRQYQPELKYLLVDELRLPAALSESRDLLAAIAALEQSEDPEGILAVVERLIDWLRSDEDSDLRRAFTAWLQLVLIPIKLGDAEELPEVDNLMEMKTMLVQNMQRWVARQEADLDRRLDERVREVLPAIEAKLEARLEARLEAKAKAKARAELEEAMETRRRREIEFLTKLIERKFGPLSPAERARLSQVDSAQRERWGLRLLDATSRDEVFD